MTAKVYVVIAELGEYSDRNDWIAGVFTDKAEAERIVLEKSRWKMEQDGHRRVWGLAVKARAEELKEFPTTYERIQAAKEEIGPAPETADWDRLYLTEVPLDVWGEFPF